MSGVCSFRRRMKGRHRPFSPPVQSVEDAHSSVPASYVQLGSGPDWPGGTTTTGHATDTGRCRSGAPSGARGASATASTSASASPTAASELASWSQLAAVPPKSAPHVPPPQVSPALHVVPLQQISPKVPQLDELLLASEQAPPPAARPAATANAASPARPRLRMRATWCDGDMLLLVPGRPGCRCRFFRCPVSGRDASPRSAARGGRLTPPRPNRKLERAPVCGLPGFER